MALPGIIHVRSTEIIRAEIRDRITGEPITSGTVTLKIYDLSGNTLATYPLTPIPDSPGFWTTLLPATFTSTLKVNQRYRLSLSISAEHGDYYSEQVVLAKVHELE